jgi:hypothetical protein
MPTNISAYFPSYIAAGKAQSVQKLTAGWTAEVFEFKSRYRQDSSPLHVVQTGSKAHPASYLMSTGGPYSRGKVTEA